MVKATDYGRLFRTRVVKYRAVGPTITANHGRCRHRDCRRHPLSTDAAPAGSIGADHGDDRPHRGAFALWRGPEPPGSRRAIVSGPRAGDARRRIWPWFVADDDHSLLV